MKISDIQWNSTIIECQYDDELAQTIEAESEVSILFDGIAKRYYIQYSNNSFYINPTRAGLGVLDSVIKKSKPEEYIAWVLDNSNKTLSIKICPFAYAVVLNNFQKMSIEISNKVVTQLKKTSAIDAIPALEKEFVYINPDGKKALFVIGISEFDNQKNEKAFTIISAKKRLTIARQGEKFVAVNYGRNQRAIYQPISVFYGPVDFVSSGLASAVSEACNQYVSNVLNEDGYIQLWNEYNNIEKLMIMQEAREFGAAAYDDCKVSVSGNIIYKFHVTDYAFKNLTEDIELDITDDESVMKANDSSNSDNHFQTDVYSEYVGTFLKYEDNWIYVVDKKHDTPKKSHKRGYLFKSIFGDNRRLERRNRAKDVISSGNAPIPLLASLINTGVGETAERNHPVKTNELLKTLKDKNGDPLNINSRQEHAIQIALNTPDIALIQGPPGTGKTTVIEAIAARFEEIYKKDNGGLLPKILISSFQHVAVDNAIEKIDFTGIPANRIGGKAGEEDLHENIIETWVKKSCKKIDEYAENHATPEIFSSIDILRNAIFSWKNKGQDLTEGFALLKDNYEKSSLYVSPLLRDRIQSLLAYDTVRNSGEAKKSIKDDEQQNLYWELCNLRLTEVSFSDDGLSNLRDFIDDIELGIYSDVADIKLPQCVYKTCSSKGTDHNSFAEYCLYVENLKNKYKPITAPTVVMNATDEIDQCLNDLLLEMRNHLLQQFENIEEAKCEILLEYKEALLSGGAEDIVQEYSDIKAATCQQSMDKHGGDVYDLVIIDEAARANPLDLFIPMSMGRKIVLVGDQKQLPHMIEPSVLKQLERMPGDKFNFYKESFFEYLFNKLKKDGDEISPFAKACTLNEQYRMLPEISDFLKDAIYQQEDLKCGSSEETIAKKRINIGRYSGKPIVWRNVDIGIGKNSKEEGKQSKYRDAEVDAIYEEINSVLSSEPSIKSVGIITFYAKQREKLIDALESHVSKDKINRLEKIEIGTVDAFQGKEYDVVFLSCVRSNDLRVESDDEIQRFDEIRKKVGFLNDNNRLCVALSRGRSLLVCVGDEETVQYVDILRDLIRYCKSDKGCYLGNIQ